MPPGDPMIRLPKGLHHIISTKPNKFAGKIPSRLPHGSTQFVQPRDRVRKWNIRPGDKVRLLVGSPKVRFLNKENSTEGWKVFNVKQVDLERGRVYLEGVNNIKGNVIHNRPSNYEELTADQQQSYDQQKNFVNTMRPVHYSNVQLCLEDKGGPDSVFASRIATSSTHFSKESQRLEWRRFAARVSADTASVPVDTKVNIPWPKPDKPYEHPAADPRYETDNQTAQGTTLSLTSVSTLTKTAVADIIPQHKNAPPPSDQTFVDEYLAQIKGKRVDQLARDAADLVMPLYLSEELSPRFAKSKMYKAYKTRREVESEERRRTGDEAIKKWIEKGKDKDLTKILDLEDVGLEGVYMRPRSKEEIRQSAQVEYDLRNEEMRKEVNVNVRNGLKWNQDIGQWVKGKKALEIDRKRERKERKEWRTLDKLQDLSL